LEGRKVGDGREKRKEFHILEFGEGNVIVDIVY